MSGFNPSQVAFSAGEWSEAMFGRVDLEGYRKALSYCCNFKPRPQGPGLMRAGSIFGTTWSEADPPRLFEMRISGSREDYVAAVGAAKVRLYDRNGLISFHKNLLVNGTFDGGITGWTSGGNNGDTWLNGTVGLGVQTTPPYYGGLVFQNFTAVVGHTYRIRGRARCDTLYSGAKYLSVYYGAGSVQLYPTKEWMLFDVPIVATGTTFQVRLETFGLVAGDKSIYVDDVVCYDEGAALISEFTSPFSAEQLAAIQYSSELSKNRLFLVHRQVQPEVLVSPVSGVIDFYAATFANQPSSWGSANWPGVVEAGFQGRLWVASTPNDPHVFWASKSGSPFDFDLGTGTASDGMSLSVTSKGELEWMQGQRIMLMGSEAAEHVMQSASGLIKTSDFDIQDGSSFGSAPVQARHIGDQVLFVTSDRRKVRALDYSWEKQAWFSRAITWAAEDIIDSDIVELHFSRTPDPVIIAVLASGELRACTYDRSENIVAWWRVVTAGLVKSAAVARTADGDELWLSVVRNSQNLIERIPMHEVGVSYVDSAKTGTVSARRVGDNVPVINGLTHLEGQTVRIIVDGALLPDQVVVAGLVVLAEEQFGLPYVVGLTFNAQMKTLPLEGGLQTGSSASAKRRRTKVRLRLNNSALPLVNGMRSPERAPADPMDTGIDLVTGDVDCNLLGWEDDGALTIEQDLPFRTEILAIFGNAQVNEV